MTNPYDDIREQFLEADTRFKEAITTTFTAHSQCVVLFLTALERAAQREAAMQAELQALRETVTELRETVSQLQALVFEQGGELRALRERLDGRG